MIEVWNKIDLLSTPINYESTEKTDYPVVPVSALMNLNIKKLLNIIEDKSNSLMGKRMVQLKHSIEVHSDRLQWLFK